MGAQLSQDSSAGGIAASPGISSLGSNGQKGGTTPRSASERSLAMSSSLSSSRHSAIGRLCSPPPPPPLHHFRDPYAAAYANSFMSPRDCHNRRQRQQSHIARGDGRRSAKEYGSTNNYSQHHHGSLSRWQSLTKALPNLMRGGGDAFGGTRSGSSGKRHTQQQLLAFGPNRTNQFTMPELDANNNEAALPFSSFDDHPYAHQQFATKSPYCDGDSTSGRTTRDFSLKASLRKSGSRFLNSIVRNGYLRALLSDSESDTDSEPEPDHYQEEEEGVDGRSRQWVEESSMGRLGNNNTMLLNNNNDRFMNDNNNNKHWRRDSNSFFPPQHIPPAKSSLRSSLRNCKRHLMGQPPENTRQIASGNGLVSSVLLAMAAGHQAPRPLSYPPGAQIVNDQQKKCLPTIAAGTGLGLDWNGNQCSGPDIAGHVPDSGELRSPCRDPLMFSRKKVIQASSTELMRALGCFIGVRCKRLAPQFEPIQLTTWLRGVDRALILQGWQDVAFINPANLVFLFMLIRDSFAHGECVRLRSLDELHSFVLLCLYISYSYMGNEISYPLKPFITEHTNRTNFWSHCVRLIKCHSAQMLRLNSSSTLFLEVFTELKNYSPGDP